MKVKLKDGRILPIEEKSLIALNDNGQTVEVPIEDIESLENSSIDWMSVRKDIAMILVGKENLSDYSRNSYWAGRIFNAAKVLTLQLMEDME